MITTLEHAVQIGDYEILHAQLDQREKAQRKLILQIVKEILFNGGSNNVAEMIVQYSAPWQRFLSCTIDNTDIVLWSFNKLQETCKLHNVRLLSQCAAFEEYLRVESAIELFFRWEVLEARYDEEQKIAGSFIAIKQLFNLFYIRKHHVHSLKILEILIKKIESPNFERHFPENELSKIEKETLSFFYTFYENYKEYIINNTNQLFTEFKLTIERLQTIKTQCYLLVKKMNLILVKNNESTLPLPLFIEEIYKHYSSMKQKNGYLISIYGKPYQP